MGVAKLADAAIMIQTTKGSRLTSRLWVVDMATGNMITFAVFPNQWCLTPLIILYITTMNVIILTTGLSGSSVVTGLIKKAGYWTGESTVYKNNSSGKYETHENTELVNLNDQLVKQAGFEFGHDAWYKPEAIAQFAKLHGSIDEAPYRQFIEQENSHSPWLWKDPRLWFSCSTWTIPVLLCCPETHTSSGQARLKNGLFMITTT